jgi:aromatic ring hydroxylase
MLISIRALEAFAVAVVERPLAFEGHLFANPDLLDAATTMIGEAHTTSVRHLTQIAGARVIGTPSADVLERIGDAAEQYFRGDAPNVRDNVSLYQLVRDMTCSAWGGRRALYEAFQGGDVTVRKVATYSRCNKATYVADVRRILGFARTDEQP